MTVPSKTHAQRAYGGMMGGHGSEGMMGPGGYGMMGHYGPGMMGGCPMMGATADGQDIDFSRGGVSPS